MTRTNRIKTPLFALAAVALVALLAPLASRADIFLFLNDVPGASTDARHRYWIDVLGLEFVSSAAASRPSSGLKVRFRTCIASPKLMQLSLSGAIFQGRTFIDIQTDTQTQYVKTRLTLHDVRVSKFTMAMPNANPTSSMDEVELTYSKIEWEEVPLNPDGTRGPTTKSGYDLVNNRPY